MFEYIKQWYTIISEKLLTTTVVHISGESRIGKTYLAKACMGRVSDLEYFKLYLKAYNNYNPTYGPFLLGLMKSDAIYETTSELLIDFLTTSDNSKVKLLGEVIRYSRSFKEKRFAQLNNIELSIINRISYHARQRPLFLIVDDFEKWDEDSKKLLLFFLTKEARESIPFLKGAKIIIVSEENYSIDSIKEFCPNVFSATVSGYKETKFFTKDLTEMSSTINKDLIKTLFDISKGNSGLSHDIITYLKDGYSDESASAVLRKTEYKTLFSNILDRRAHNIDKEHPHFIQTIKAASVIGEIFNQIYLSEIIEENEFAIDKILVTAQNQNFIEAYENSYYLYSFFNKIVFQFFDENFNQNKKEYHYRFAMAIKKFKPDDYYMQFQHLRASGKIFEATEMLAIHLIRQELSCYSIDGELNKYLRDYNPELFEDYEIIRQVIKAYNNGLYKDAQNQLEMITPISEFIVHEKDYLKAYLIYDSGDSEYYHEACDILTEHFNTLQSLNFDTWLRSSILLYIFYVNRLCDEQNARIVEKNIMREIAKRYKFNPDLEITIQTLNRNSAAIYSTEIALKKVEKSVKYFEKHAQKEPLQYIMALTNYSGLLMIASNYQEGFYFSKIGIEFLQSKQIWAKNSEKLINNYIVNGFLAHELSCWEALEIYEQLLADNIMSGKVLLLNNYYYFKLLTGKTDGLYEKFNALFESDAVQKHNDYYIYLTGINLICISLVMNQFFNAKSIFKKLNKMVPSICQKEEYYIKMRYNVFEKIVSLENTYFDNFVELEKFFAQELSMFPYDYVKRPYILTDQQFWSIL